MWWNSQVDKTGTESTPSLMGLAEREIPEEVAQRTDHSNEFPMDMWQRLGDAGYGKEVGLANTGLKYVAGSWVSQREKITAVSQWATKHIAWLWRS